MDSTLEKVKNLLTLTHRAGKVYFGLTTAKDLIAKGFKGFLIIADDVSPRVERECSFFKKRGYNVYQIPVSKKNLGSWFGKGEVGLLFLPNHSLTFKIESLLKNFRFKKDSTPYGRGLKHKEVTSLETKRIRRRIGNRLQKTPSNIKGEFWSKRSGKHKGYRGFKANNRPHSGSVKNSSPSSRRGRKS